MIKDMSETKGRLYVVATPIGNPKDITLRAIEILQDVQAIICEEHRIGSTLLKKLGIQKEIIVLNEHNEAEKAPDVAHRILRGESMALISDCGTPVFADPGASLIAQLAEWDVPITPIPGPSSLMAALSVLDFRLERFHFAGFLPREKTERRNTLRGLRNMRVPIVVMDTPYRLMQVLDDVASVFGSNARITLCLDLTLPGEIILRGKIDEVRHKIKEKKSEFVLIIH